MEVATDAENPQKDGCTCWKSFRKLHGVHSGRRPATTSAVYNQEGFLTSSPEGLRDHYYYSIPRWRDANKDD